MDIFPRYIEANLMPGEKILYKAVIINHPLEFRKAALDAIEKKTSA